MGMGIATTCIAAGFKVYGYDPNESLVNRLIEAGGCLMEDSLAKEIDAVIIVVVNAEQMNAVLFADQGIAQQLRPGSVVLGCPTVTPKVAKETEERLNELGIAYLDCPISGGSVKAAQGKLSVMAAGTQTAFDASRPILHAIAENVFELGNHAGPGSAMKSVNQLLAGVHIAATAEAMTFGISQGIDAAKILEVISECAGTSWMFENRGPHIVEGDFSPHSSVEIFVKDLGIVDDIARSTQAYTPLTTAALQEFLAAKASGFGKLDDSAVAKVFAHNSGIELCKESK